MDSGSCIRTVCGAMIAVSIALDIAGADAGDWLLGEQPSAIDTSAALIENTGGGRQLWSRQPGTGDRDSANGVATDKFGNVYVVGTTDGALGGPNKGYVDAWVIKFDGSGRRLWSRQPGTSEGDGASGVATDRDGNVYLVGYTDGALGGPYKGNTDAWVIKFDRSGRRLWSRQPGTSSYDTARGVATDQDGNVYIVGETGPYNANTNAWVIKFDRHGNRLWSRQPGTSGLSARGVATDQDGNVYVVGYNRDLGDAWVIKFDGSGRQLWSRQPGTSSLDTAEGVATDRDGNVYVVGTTDGALGGPHNGDIGYDDGWVIKFDASGQRLWSRQPGDYHIDTSTGVATDKDGNVYVVGATDGALGGPLKGDYDAWVIKYAR